MGSAVSGGVGDPAGDSADDRVGVVDRAGLVARLAGTPPGPGLWALLAGVDPAGLDELDQLTWLAAAERLQAGAAGLVNRALAVIAARPAVPGFPNAVREEVAAALRVSGRGAENRLALAADLDDRLPATGAGLAAGRFSLAHARVIHEALCLLDTPTARSVEVGLAELAGRGRVTATQLARAARRAAARANPAALAEQEEQIHADRRLWFDFRNSCLFAQLTADTLPVVAGALNSLAERTGPDDPRRTEVRLVDALVELCTRHTPAAAGSFTGYRTGVQLVTTADTLLGLSDAPAEILGYGPVPADTARRLSCHGLFHRLLVEPDTGRLLDMGRTRRDPDDRLRRYIHARDQHCQFPGCTRPAHRCEIHHADPWSRGGPTDRVNLLTVCPRHHHAVHEGGWRATRHPDESTSWTSPSGRRSRVTPEPPPVEYRPTRPPATPVPVGRRAGPVA